MILHFSMPTMYEHNVESDIKYHNPPSLFPSLSTRVLFPTTFIGSIELCILVFNSLFYLSRGPYRINLFIYPNCKKS